MSKPWIRQGKRPANGDPVVGGAIRYMREGAAVSLRDFANAAGITVVELSDIERGISPLPEGWGLTSHIAELLEKAVEFRMGEV